MGFLAGKSLNTQSYMVCMYSSGQPYLHCSRNFAGYKGEDARRVWATIYDQSAMKEAAAAVAATHPEGPATR